MSTTTDLSKFGYREIDEAIKLLQAYKNGAPDAFTKIDVVLTFNQNLGNVFLSNDNFDAIMLTDSGELEMYYVTPYDGIEGFLEDLYDEYENMCEEDRKWFKEIYLENGEKVLPLMTSSGSFIQEGQKYYIIDGNDEIVESNLDKNTDYDRSVENIFETSAEAEETLKNRKNRNG